MRDIVFVALVVAFFVLAAAYVRACDWIAGPDEVQPVEHDELVRP